MNCRRHEKLTILHPCKKSRRKIKKKLLLMKILNNFKRIVIVKVTKNIVKVEAKNQANLKFIKINHFMKKYLQNLPI